LFVGSFLILAQNLKHILEDSDPSSLAALKEGAIRKKIVGSLSP
jgi:hypothetical protein